MGRSSIVAALLFCACSRSMPDGAVATPDPVGTKLVPPGPTTTPTPPPKLVPKENVLLRLDADLDGSGPVPVTVADDGTLRIGALVTDVEVTHAEYFFDKQAALRLVEIDASKKLRGVLFSEPTSEGEDPPNRHRLFLVIGGAIHVAYDRVLGTYGPIELTFPGTGIATYREDAWSACDRAKYPVVVAKQDVTLKLDAAMQLVEVARKASPITVKCAELAG